MNTYVLAVCGRKHGERANFCLRALRKFTNDNIIVIASRVDGINIECDQIIRCDYPQDFNDAQCSRLLKTGVLSIIKKHVGLGGVYCYLDNDVFAVSPSASSIFGLYRPPITFGIDPGKTVNRFSKYAIDRGSLHIAIEEDFGICVDKDWKIWNGGMFLFDYRSEAFLATWHEFTGKIFSMPRWVDRDQGTLIATVWCHNLQVHYTMPPEYNWLHKLQGGLRPQEDRFITKWGNDVFFLHFPVSYGKSKYKSWKKLVEILND